MADDDGTLVLDCDTCEMRGTAACDDCVVSFLVDRPDRVELDGAEVRALRSLARGGLVPEVRYRPKAV